MRLKLEFNSSLIRWLRRAAVVVHRVTCLAGNYALVVYILLSLSPSLSLEFILYLEDFLKIVLSPSYKYEKQLIDNETRRQRNCDAQRINDNVITPSVIIGNVLTTTAHNRAPPN